MSSQATLTLHLFRTYRKDAKGIQLNIILWCYPMNLLVEEESTMESISFISTEIRKLFHYTPTFYDTLINECLKDLLYIDVKLPLWFLHIPFDQCNFKTNVLRHCFNRSVFLNRLIAYRERDWSLWQESVINMKQYHYYLYPGDNVQYIPFRKSGKALCSHCIIISILHGASLEVKYLPSQFLLKAF